MAAPRDPGATSARRAAADVVVQLLGQIGNLALGVVVTILVVRTLGPPAYGRWTTIFAVVTLASAFGDLGLETVAVGRAAADRPRESSWIGGLVLVRAALSIPVALGTAAVLLLLSTNSAMRTAGLVITLTTLLSAPASLRTIFQLRMRNDRTIAVTTLNSVLWAGAVIAIAASHRGIVALALGFTAAAVLSTTAAAIAASRMGTVRFDGVRERARELITVGLPVSVAGLLVTAYVRIDQVLVFELSGSHAAGLYAVSYRILDQAQFVPVAVMTTLYPMMSAAYPGDLPRVRHLSQQAGEYLLMASLPALAFAIADGGPLMTLLFGRAYAGSGTALPILLGAYVAIALGHLIGSLRIVVGLQRRFVIYAAAGLVVNVALNLLLIPSYGYVAAAVVTVVTEVLVLLLTGRAVLRKLAFRPQLGRPARIVAAAAIMGAIVGALRAVGAGPIPLAGAAAVSYTALLFGSGALGIDQVRLLLGRQTGSV